MARCWVIPTDPSSIDAVILPSLEAGELRQGWGYQDDQNLEVIGPLVRDRGRDGLTDPQKATWRRVQRFWPEHSGPVCPGDLVLLPKVPAPGRWRLVEITEAYRFDPHPLSGDHGHILGCKTLVPEIAPTSVVVDASLQRTMRNQGPMWNIDALAPAVRRLVEDADAVRAPSDVTDRLRALLDDTIEGLRPRLREGFQANQLEEPVRRLLQHRFPDATVEMTAGPHERGADFVVRETDGFGHERTTVVQLKDQDPLDNVRALEQAQEAVDAHSPASAAVIVTTALSEGREFARRRAELEEALGLPLTVVLGHELVSWFLAHLEAITAD